MKAKAWYNATSPTGSLFRDGPDVVVCQPSRLTSMSQHRPTPLVPRVISHPVGTSHLFSLAGSPVLARGRPEDSSRPRRDIPRSPFEQRRSGPPLVVAARTEGGGHVLSLLLCCWGKQKPWGLHDANLRSVLSSIADLPFVAGDSYHELYLEQYWFSSFEAGLPAPLDFELLEFATNDDQSVVNQSPDFLSGDPEDSEAHLLVATVHTTEAIQAMRRAEWPSFRRYILDTGLIPEWNFNNEAINGEDKKMVLVVAEELKRPGGRLRPSAKSPLWKLLGFQSADPRTDFRGGGFLSLLMMLSLAQRHKNVWKALMENFAKVGIPGSAALVNLTFMLTFCLGLRPVGRCASRSDARLSLKGQKRAMAWLRAIGPEGLEDLFCACCRYLLFTLTDGKGPHDFQKALADTKMRVIQLYDDGITGNSGLDLSRIWRNNSRL